MAKNKNKRSRSSPNKESSGSAAAAASQQPSSNAAGPKSDSLTGSDIAASLKGSPFEPLAEVIASLPKQIATYIKDKSTSMFSLQKQVKEREASLALYSKKIVDKTSGEEVDYRPKCARINNPISSSRFLKEDPAAMEELKNASAQYDTLIKDYGDAATKVMKSVAELEVKYRVSKLRDETMEVMFDLSNMLTTYAFEMAKVASPPFVSAIPVKSLATAAINEIVREMPETQAQALYWPTKDSIMEKLQELIDRTENWNRDELINATQPGDNAILIKVKAQIRTYFPLMTTSAWAATSRDDMLRKVNSAVSAMNAEKEHTTATEQLAVAMDLDDGLTEDALKNMVEKSVNDALKKQEKALRKKYMAEIKIY